MPSKTTVTACCCTRRRRTGCSESSLKQAARARRQTLESRRGLHDSAARSARMLRRLAGEFDRRAAEAGLSRHCLFQRGTPRREMRAGAHGPRAANIESNSARAALLRNHSEWGRSYLALNAADFTRLLLANSIGTPRQPTAASNVRRPWRARLAACSSPRSSLASPVDDLPAS